MITNSEATILFHESLSSQPVKHPFCPFCGTQQSEGAIAHLQNINYSTNLCIFCGSTLHLQQEVDFIENIWQDAEESNNKALDEQLSLVQKELDEKIAENASNEEIIDNHLLTIDSYKKTIDSLQEENNTLEQEVKDAEEALQDRNDDIKTANAGLLQLEERIAFLQEKHNENDHHYAALLTSYEKLLHENDILRDSLSLAEGRLKGIAEATDLLRGGD